MLLVRRRIDMHMVRHIVQNHIDIVLMRCRQQRAELLVRTETQIQLRRIYRPVTVISAELRIRLARVVLIAVLELIAPPRIPRVLRHRRHPNRVDSQTVKESLFYLLRDAREVTTLVIHNIQHLR